MNAALEVAIAREDRRHDQIRLFGGKVLPSVRD
jgi:hypothetical protein